MQTSYQEIYDLFVRKITDFNLMIQDDEDIEQLCYKYLESAIANFMFCKHDLSKRDIGKFNGGFHSTLNIQEKEILSLLMIVEWLTPQIYNITLIKQFVGDSEFNMTSQANHLDKLSQLKQQAIEDSEKLITLYTYDDEEGIKELV